MVSSSNPGQQQLTFDMSFSKDVATVSPTENEKPRQLFLLDGMALVYRAFFALQRTGMSTREGIPTGATYGFLTTLLKIREAYSPTHLAVAFDSAEKTFRHELYEPYKANRPEPPEDLVVQLDTIFDLIDALRIPVLKMPGFEADDLIGSAARQFEKECPVFIVTPDKDLAQLVHDGVRILKPGKKQNELDLMGANEVREQFGVGPERFTDFLTLTGDTSDNIPGAKGIGPKTAAKLLDSYGSLDNIMAHLDELPGKSRKSLEEFRERLGLVRQLVTIRTDLDLGTSFEEMACVHPDSEKLFRLLDKLELKTIAARVPQLFPGTARSENHDPEQSAEHLRRPHEGASYHLVDTERGVADLVEKLNARTSFAIDTETTSLDTFEAELVGLSVSWKPGEAWFVHCSKGGLETQTALGALRPVLENPAILKTGQNLKYDILVLKNHGIHLGPVGFDTMLASYVINPGEKHNLDDLAERLLGYRTTKYSDLVGTGRKAVPIRDVPLGVLTDYACQDADVALQLEESLAPALRENSSLDWLCRNIEFPLVKVLADMEYHGIALDTKHLAETAATVREALAGLTERIHETAGTPFNIDSPKQLGNILFNVLGLPSKKTTKTGYSTDVRVLEELSALHPMVRDVLEYRSLQKLRSTYIEALPKMLNPRTGRLHTSFNQHITTTGRLSSSNPNLQNIPIRTELGREIRKAFIPSTPEAYLLSADYSQIELRIAAEISGDSKLIDAFRNREDIHTATARVVFDTEDITADMRRKAKEVNFGVLYGLQAFGLAQRLNISRNEASNIIETYKSKYPALFDSLQNIIGEASGKGYVTTLLGRRRYIENLGSRNGNVRKAAERAAMNMPIQGTAADIIKCAMCLVSRRTADRKMQSSMLLQVHDELVFETSEEEREELTSIVEESMIEAAEICGLKTVPVEVETGVGRNWLDAH